jgi:hypothetical protein
MKRAENVSIERFITFSNGWKYDWKSLCKN